MMDSVHLVHVFSTFAPGGPQVRTAAIMNALPPGYRHSILAMDGRTDCQERIGSHVSFEVLPLELDPRSRLFPFKLVGRLRSLRPDLLLTYNWGAIESVLASRLGRIAPIVHFEEGFRPDEASGSQKTRRVLARRFLLSGRVRAVVVPSLQLQEIATETWKLKPSRVRYIPNAVDGKRFLPGEEKELRESFGAKPDDLILGAIAHLTEVKDLGYLVRAFAGSGLSKKALLVIAGDGPEEKDLLTLTRDLGVEDRVRFLGRIPDTASYYRTFDLFAVSSRTEQMPVTVLEAMSSGLPILSTDVGDIKAMVAGSNQRFVVKREEVEAYRDRCRELAKDPVLRKKLGAENRERCLAAYDLQQMFTTYHELFEEARTSS